MSDASPTPSSSSHHPPEDYMPMSAIVYTSVPVRFFCVVLVRCFVVCVCTARTACAHCMRRRWLELIMQHDEGPPRRVERNGKYLIVFLDYLSLSRYNCNALADERQQSAHSIWFAQVRMSQTNLR